MNTTDPVPIATLVLVIINLIIAAFSYGKLNQQVQDACRRIEKLESWREGKVT